jgi:hypothetical protein
MKLFCPGSEKTTANSLDPRRTLPRTVQTSKDVVRGGGEWVNPAIPALAPLGPGCSAV